MIQNSWEQLNSYHIILEEHVIERVVVQYVHSRVRGRREVRREVRSDQFTRSVDQDDVRQEVVITRTTYSTVQYSAVQCSAVQCSAVYSTDCVLEFEPNQHTIWKFGFKLFDFLPQPSLFAAIPTQPFDIISSPRNIMTPGWCCRIIDHRHWIREHTHCSWCNSEEDCFLP